jgi:hypothetical protein
MTDLDEKSQTVVGEVKSAAETALREVREEGAAAGAELHQIGVKAEEKVAEVVKATEKALS